jgi:hypothetical protein
MMIMVELEVRSRIQGLDLRLGLLEIMIKTKISGINSHSRTSCLWPRFKLEEVELVIVGSNLSSSKFQMIVKIGFGPRANRRSIMQTQIETP